MKILICVKQVPEIMDITINPETGTLMREGVDSILNPFCEYAVEMGLDLKRRYSDIETVAILLESRQ
jgi:electron transfer flavoprotein beta subunit